MKVSTNSAIMALILVVGGILWLVLHLSMTEWEEMRFSLTSTCIISVKVYHPSLSSSFWIHNVFYTSTTPGSPWKRSELIYCGGL